MTHTSTRTAAVLLAVAGLAAGASPARAGFTVAWGGSGTTVTNDVGNPASMYFFNGSMTFAGVETTGVLQISDLSPTGPLANVNYVGGGFGAPLGINFQIDVRIDGGWVNVYDRYLSSGAGRYYLASTPDLSFSRGVVDGIRFRSPVGYGSPNYRDFSTNLLFTFDTLAADPSPTAVPAPAGLVLIAGAVPGFLGVRLLRRRKAVA